MAGVIRVVFVVVVLSFAWTNSVLAQDMQAGQDLAEKKCGRCHATGLNDKSKLETAPPFRTLSSRYPVENLAEALAEGIVVGHHAMPEFVLDPDQIGNLLAYIEWLGAQTKKK